MTRRQRNRQLKTGGVVLTATAVLMTALAACGSSTKKYCVDEDDFRAGRGYRVINKKYCSDSDKTKVSDSSSLKIKGVVSDPEWYYKGKKKKGWAKGGTFNKPG
ncbi:hypothetical protein [Streptomyces apocyni]|uniref:hypothetical protein n=1 Tax=Streptomyces apocyni TaxID=2654677 RepID=UPI0012EAB3BD|nr:hypothetical protein [Streptomyces apocyni]